MLALEDVHASYGTSHIVQGVSLNVPEGGCLALLGRNGVGKTTLVRAIAGLMPVSGGTVQFGGTRTTHLPPHRIARLGIGLVPQGRRIFSTLTVRENLTMAARPGFAAASARWTIERIWDLFPTLRARQHNLGNELSGGQQQMLAIGRALLTNPRLLLMDEPSEGLAPIVIEQIGAVLADLKPTGLALLLVEQNVALACSVADTVAIMNKGQIVWRGTPHALRADEAVQHEYLGV
jgi:branched-chain amino acid transport system ATP-binding protein